MYRQANQKANKKKNLSLRSIINKKQKNYGKFNHYLISAIEYSLIIALAVYVKRFNYEKKLNDFKKTSYEVKNNILVKENNSLKNEQQIYAEKINELIKKCDRQNAEIESLQSINSTLLNDNRKLSDELQEIKNKPFDPLKELDNLTIRKEEKPTPEAKPEKKRNKKETEKESARRC